MSFQVSAILLAGGHGTRLKSKEPKQYLPLKGKPICLYSFEQLLACPFLQEIIIVASAPYRSLFQSKETPLKFAEPGRRRQDSVLSGLKSASPSSQFILIHDAARPFIDQALLETVLESAFEGGAATLAVPLKFTVKQADAELRVQHTPDRTCLFEIQTPQVLRRDWLEKGLDLPGDLVDDVSAAEKLGHPVQLVSGSHANIKITTLEDLIFAEAIGLHLNSFRDRP
ncbi:MAG: hypothetical protein K0S07_1253 [Chlamydiales bacterium]|jgi:2-C-methyl-D-erythritol 4-phosphate cytidylyltransferase|nr:hypothetical protein [Chlamydiales bacterium]